MTQKNALLSVFDKAGIVDFARALIALGWNIYSSGGTAKVIAAAGLPVTDVAELVGGEAILGHRVVTLSREVHGGLLAQYEKDLEEMEALGLPYIDLVCFNLYPLAEAVADPDATTESVIEKTDIGGPAALNSGAKGGRIVIGDPVEYQSVLDWLQAGEPDRDEFIRKLRAKAFFTTSKYYLPAARFHSDGEYDGMLGALVAACDYGENRWQSPAGLYSTGSDDPLALDRFKVVDGRTPSFINWTDADRLQQIVAHIVAGQELNFAEVPLVAVAVKHGNPCGAAIGNDPVEVLQKTVMGDPQAVFGAVLMTNFAITEELATVLRRYGMPPKDRRLLDGVCAPAIDEAAYSVLARKDGKYFLAVNPALGELSSTSLDTMPLLRPVRGGFLKQPNYTHVLAVDELEVHGDMPSDDSLRDLVLAWAICATSNSNTVTLVKDGCLIGNGVGQQDRVGCCVLAVQKANEAGHTIRGAAAASDSFFPFPDGPEVLLKAGVGYIFSTSGSKQDDAVRAICAQYDATLLQQPDAEARSFYRH